MDEPIGSFSPVQGEFQVIIHLVLLAMLGCWMVLTINSPGEGKNKGAITFLLRGALLFVGGGPDFFWMVKGGQSFFKWIRV